jgi:hypothetical protein
MREAISRHQVAIERPIEVLMREAISQHVLADAGRTDEAHDLALRRALERADRNELEDALLDVLEAVVVLGEHLHGTACDSRPSTTIPSHSDAVKDALSRPQSRHTHSACTRHAIGMQSECNWHAISHGTRTCSGERGGESKWGGQSACMHTHLLLVALAI